ncbi:NUDIX hydrolase [Nostoc sp. TCL26-01]|uniref:NUDIX hydrolase n=1 Tax=Nostoc sp. TCL26-01 TaxID=2576904 RepID=UPI0015C176BD|nr:NUDIX hydrolase [Nostoc sp. TCL26-01]QLE56354.1 NUDIX hydrolase [Nostoc sp. TCL26-01]
MSKLQKWQILKSNMVLNHQWCQVRQDEIQLPSGQIIDDYFVNIRPDIVLVLPITASREVVFVRQYRHGIEKILMELPAGRFDSNTESAADAGIRELREETGYVAENLTKIATLYDNPSKDTNQIHLFLAENVVKLGEQNLDITEEIEVILIPVESVLEKITQGEILVVGTIAALLLGLQFLIE